MKKLNRKHLFIILAVVVAFLLPFFIQNNKPIYAEYGEGATCSPPSHPGSCKDRVTKPCTTYYDSGGYCPGDNSVQCCVTTQVSCKSGTGQCHNRYASGFGNAYACSGTWYTGLCPGPSDVQCCVPAPTSTPTPTLTPTPTPGPASTKTPGIIFTGDGAADFGSNDRSSVQGWVVGGTTYSEVFSKAKNPSPLSYQRLFDKATKAKLTMIPMTSISGCSVLTNCSILDANLAHGIYIANGNVNLNTYTFQGSKDYIFLIKGDLRIMGKIITTNGSTVLFSSSNDIIIDKSVGAATNTYPLPNAQIQGLFNADRNFTVDGIYNCATGTDKMLNIEGAIVTNSGIGATGTFRNFRDLCTFNATIPSVTVRHRLDFLLNAPEFIMTTNTTFRETP